MLRDIDEFLGNMEPCIEGITGDERNIATFMKLMRIFHEVINILLHFTNID